MQENYYAILCVAIIITSYQTKQLTENSSCLRKIQTHSVKLLLLPKYFLLRIVGAKTQITAVRSVAFMSARRVLLQHMACCPFSCFRLQLRPAPLSVVQVLLIDFTFAEIRFLSILFYLTVSHYRFAADFLITRSRARATRSAERAASLAAT